jgi:hypothetical protein
MKYKWRGILFKIASGDQGPYGGSDEAAAKAMGHELKGANAYSRCSIPSLHVSLQALIDYKGFRIHAQALLKIDKDRTLQVGSSDAGKSVYNRSPALHKKMKAAAGELNLCRHVVRGVPLYSACDVEGHLDAAGRFCLIDLARLFPPEHPDCVQHLMLEVGSNVLVRRAALSLPPPLSGGAGLAAGGGSPLGEAQWVDAVITASRLPAGAAGAGVGTAGAAGAGYAERAYDVHSKYGTETIQGTGNLGYCKKCIYWKFLRPEFVKHRGRALISAWAGQPVGDADPDTGAGAGAGEGEGEGDLESDMPPMNPLLRKAASSVYSAVSGGANEGGSDCSSEGHMYNSFFPSSESVSAQEKRAAGAGADTPAPPPAPAPAPAARNKPPALCSDALTEFSRNDPDRLAHNKNVEIATDVLVLQLIPAMVRCKWCM